MPYNEQQAKNHLAGRWDALIVSASFEARCLQIASCLTPNRIDRVHILVNRSFAPQIAENCKKLEKLFGSRAKQVHLQNSDPVASADALVEAVVRCAGARKRILVDITTMTHEHLLILLRVLNDLVPSTCHVELAYAGAEEYSVGAKYMDKWLSHGVRQIRSVLGYPGEHRPSKGLHFIGLMGFEASRMSKIIDVYEPSLISLGYCHQTTSTNPEHAQANRHFHRIITDHYPNVSIFEFSAKDLWATQTILQNVVDAHSGYNSVVVPLNTKISTVAAGLVALANRRIQLVYAEADSYNFNAYSLPGKKFYFFGLQRINISHGESSGVENELIHV